MASSIDKDQKQWINELTRLAQTLLPMSQPGEFVFDQSLWMPHYKSGKSPEDALLDVMSECLDQSSN